LKKIKKKNNDLQTDTYILSYAVIYCGSCKNNTNYPQNRDRVWSWCCTKAYNIIIQPS
jgi:hypothetical protein